VFVSDSVNRGEMHNRCSFVLSFVYVMQLLDTYIASMYVFFFPEVMF
jgi:hypothetical protein